MIHRIPQAAVLVLLALAMALSAAPSEAANVITPRAWVLIYDCGAGLVDLRGDHGYTISQIDNNGAGKLVSVEGTLEKRRFLFPTIAGTKNFSYIVNNNPQQNLNINFSQWSDGHLCREWEFRAKTKLRWQIAPASPHITVTSGWKDRSCSEDDWQPPEI